MKISQNTLAVLGSFSKISRGIHISSGNVLRTKSNAVYAEATVAENFPEEFALEDLPDFLKMVALYNDPNFNFGPESVQIVEGDATAETEYLYARTGLVQPCGKLKTLESPAESISFALAEEKLEALKKPLGIAVGCKKKERVPFCRIISDGKTIRLSAQKSRYSKANEYTLTVEAETHGHECQMVFDTSNLPMMTGSYNVTITPNYTLLENASGCNLLYLIGMEPTLSNWGGKRTYQVRVTKSTAQDCFVLVQADSPEEAEILVRGKPDDEFKWTTEGRPTRAYRVVE